MASDAASLSIIIPAYNEQRDIARSLEEVMTFARACPTLREVIVVDDGSTDGTAAIVEAARLRYADFPAALRLVQNGRNLGKGATVRNGVLAAAGEIVLFTDADLSAPIMEAPRLVEPVAEGVCDVAIGSRAVDRSLIGVRQGRFRENAGKMFNVIVRVLTGLPIRDTQCGFKAFRRDAVLPIFELQRVGGFAFDVELLYLARRRGLRIREIPVRWSHVTHSKVHILWDSLRMFLDVLRIRLRASLGGYRESTHPAGRS
jgi:dolichyl-phosphate beta-glucosyltransferase